LKALSLIYIGSAKKHEKYYFAYIEVVSQYMIF